MENSAAETKEEIFAGITGALDELTNYNLKDFKIGSVDALKRLCDWLFVLTESTGDTQDALLSFGKEVRDFIDNDLVDFRNSVDDLRFLLLFQLSRLNVIWNTLEKIGVLTASSMPEVSREMWRQNHLDMLGFNCTVSELKARANKGFDAAEKAAKKAKDDQKTEEVCHD